MTGASVSVTRTWATATAAVATCLGSAAVLWTPAGQPSSSSSVGMAPSEWKRSVRERERGGGYMPGECCSPVDTGRTALVTFQCQDGSFRQEEVSERERERERGGVRAWGVLQSCGHRQDSPRHLPVSGWLLQTGRGQ